MTNNEQFVLAMILFDYAAAIVTALDGKIRDAKMLSIFGLVMSMIWVWVY